MLLRRPAFVCLFTGASLLGHWSLQAQDPKLPLEVEAIPIDELVESLTTDSPSPDQKISPPVEVRPIVEAIKSADAISTAEGSSVSDVAPVEEIEAQVLQRYQSVLQNRDAVARQWEDRADAVLQALPSAPAPTASQTKAAMATIHTPTSDTSASVTTVPTSPPAAIAPTPRRFQKPVATTAPVPVPVATPHRFYPTIPAGSHPCCQQLRSVRGVLQGTITRIDGVIHP
ncbi:hypothetical protein [Aporhodopirellula aestuarii]|uniref:Secreted protein n=1 Tax=Aporhodopirellula aestuarii TaxID=2950107 RepID=A0ABT0UC54_9BACT|nr:hypothetical protein [Aporhodopirellula aestuarii]MCM2374431.1 hypothetical protein [Aporhodopirellula aestuarii]